jgi:hypothetical protein
LLRRAVAARWAATRELLQAVLVATHGPVSLQATADSSTWKSVNLQQCSSYDF